MILFYNFALIDRQIKTRAITYTSSSEPAATILFYANYSQNISIQSLLHVSIISTYYTLKLYTDLNIHTTIIIRFIAIRIILLHRSNPIVSYTLLSHANHPRFPIHSRPIKYTNSPSIHWNLIICIMIK